MKIDLDTMSIDELKDLVVKLKQELDIVKDDYKTSREIWEYLCKRRDNKIEELTKKINKVKTIVNDIELKGEQNEQQHI